MLQIEMTLKNITNFNYEAMVIVNCKNGKLSYVHSIFHPQT